MSVYHSKVTECWLSDRYIRYASQVNIRFIDNDGNDISDQHKEEIEQIRTLDETDRGLRADMHNILRGDESKCIIN